MDNEQTVLARGTETITDTAVEYPTLKAPAASKPGTAAPSRRFIHRFAGLLDRLFADGLVDDLHGTMFERLFRRARGCPELPRGSRAAGLTDATLGDVGFELKTTRISPAVRRSIARLLGRRKIAMPGQVRGPAQLVTVEIEHAAIAATREAHAMIERSSADDVMRWLMKALRTHATHWAHMHLVGELRYVVLLRELDLTHWAYAEQPMTVPFLDPKTLTAEWADRGLHVFDHATGARVLSWYPGGGQVRVPLTIDLHDAVLFRLDIRAASTEAA